MKIVFCHNHYQQRTGEDLAFDFALRLLRESGHEVATCTRSNVEIEHFTLGDKLLFPMRTIYSRPERARVAKFVQEQQPSVALVQNVFPLLSPSIYDALAESDMPVVQMVFNYRLLCANGLFFTHGAICERCLLGNYAHAVLRRCYRESYTLSAVYAASLGLHRLLQTWRRSVTLFVTPDVFLKEKLVQSGLPTQRIRVVSNPVDIADYKPRYERGEYGLFVGRLARAKGVLTLLEASLLSDRLRLVVVGDGEEAETVRHHPAVLQGKAEFVGPAYGQHLDELLAGAAFVVVPSEWYDNLPMIVCQAFAAGKPVVASRINGIPEFVKHEDNGLLFSPGNVVELLQSMQRLFADLELHQKLARGARNTAETVLSPRCWQDKMTSVLQEAVELHSEA
jgi:glycosyltransferase involved in cell wall biosynthesis